MMNFDYYKKNRLHHLLCVGLIFSSVCLLPACSDDDENINSALEFQTYLPESGTKGTELSIRGNNFGNDPANVKVWVNDKEAEVTEVTRSRIFATVPSSAGSGSIRVKVGETEYTYPDQFSYTFYKSVQTYAGNGENTNSDGSLLDASFANPFWLAYDKKGDALFVLQDDNRIRRIKNGKVETLIQLGGSFNNPRSIEFSLTGDTLFIGNDNAANANNAAVAILKRSDDFRNPEILIGYPEAGTNHVNHCGVHPIDGSVIYYCYPNKIHRWDNKSKTSTLLYDVTEIASGNYANVSFSPDGKTIYLTCKYDYQGMLSATYNLTTHTIEGGFKKFAGTGSWGNADGQGTNAAFDQPGQVAFGSDGTLYTVEHFNHCIRQVTPEGYVSVYAGTKGSSGYLDGEGMSAKFNNPRGIVFNNEGQMYIVESAAPRIRLVINE